MHIAIIGAGAAGCFAAIQTKRNLPEAQVSVFESHPRALAKVSITGGGRCNLTNTFAEVKSPDAVYPRGARLMKRLFKVFNHEDTYKWFEREGIKLVRQPDQCVFPQSQNAMQVVHTLLNLMEEEGVKLYLLHHVSEISYEGIKETEDAVPTQPGNNTQVSKYRLTFNKPENLTVYADKVVVTTGGSPKMSGMDFLSPLNLHIVPPIPSLFSLCLPHHPITQLMGTVVENVTASIAGTKIRTQGPLLITHWGISGPAILKLSAHGARYLFEHDYKANVSINWLDNQKESDVLDFINDTVKQYPKKQLQSIHPEELNSRLWQHLLQQSGLRPEGRWAELGRKSYNKLAATLTNHILPVDGKNRFKEEFVTCGGVGLENLNPSTLECRDYPGLYFAGEATDVDAVTGGFNLQAAWTMGYVVAQSLAHSSKH